ncbi:MAG TPA: hypothetical protein VNQ76_16015, partial [Planctomicrobium sp.]|nr:hypothetical protein [Planctomicrobium sp.]
SINQAITQYYSPGARDEAKLSVTATAGKKGGAKAKAGSTKPQMSGAAKKAANSVSFSQLPPEVQKERKQWGLLYICWSIVVPMLPQILKSVNPILAAQMPVGLGVNIAFAAVCCGVVSWWVTQKYWK